MTGVTHRLSRAAVGSPLRIEMTLSPDSTVVRHAGQSTTASGRGFVDRIQVGHTDVLQNSGGQQVVDRVEMSWASAPRLAAPALGAEIVATSVVALALPLWWWRRKGT